MLRDTLMIKQSNLGNFLKRNRTVLKGAGGGAALGGVGGFMSGDGFYDVLEKRASQRKDDKRSTMGDLATGLGVAGAGIGASQGLQHAMDASAFSRHNRASALWDPLLEEAPERNTASTKTHNPLTRFVDRLSGAEKIRTGEYASKRDASRAAHGAWEDRHSRTIDLDNKLNQEWRHVDDVDYHKRQKDKDPKYDGPKYEGSDDWKKAGKRLDELHDKRTAANRLAGVELAELDKSRDAAEEAFGSAQGTLRKRRLLGRRVAHGAGVLGAVGLTALAASKLRDAYNSRNQ